MKRFFLPLLFLLGTTIPALAQNEDYEKILLLIVDENYEKALDKSIGYTLKDDTKKDALPYLYAAVSYFELSKMGEMEEDYPKAFKNSLKYASKYVKKDKEEAYASDWEDFFADLRLAAMEEASMELDSEKYSKAKGYYKYLINFDEQDPGAWIMRGLCESKARSKKEAQLCDDTAKKIFEERDMSDLTDEQRLLLKSALMSYAEYLSGEGRSAEAKDWLEKGMTEFQDDAEFKVTYEMIAG